MALKWLLCEHLDSTEGITASQSHGMVWVGRDTSHKTVLLQSNFFWRKVFWRFWRKVFCVIFQAESWYYSAFLLYLRKVHQWVKVSHADEKCSWGFNLAFVTGNSALPTWHNGSLCAAQVSCCFNLDFTGTKKGFTPNWSKYNKKQNWTTEPKYRK